MKKSDAQKSRKAGHALGDDFARRGDPLAGALIHQEVEKDFAESKPEISTLRALRMAREELLTLRKQNKTLSAQVHVMEVFELALRARAPEYGMGASEDVTYLLQREINRLDPPIKKS